jgi:hypothetical protein
MRGIAARKPARPAPRGRAAPYPRVRAYLTEDAPQQKAQQQQQQQKPPRPAKEPAQQRSPGAAAAAAAAATHSRMGAPGEIWPRGSVAAMILGGGEPE